MPFIKIKSLKFEKPINIGEIIVNLSKEFSGKVGIDLEHIHVIWEYLDPDHYAMAGKTTKEQPLKTHPILVDLLVPEFIEPDKIKMMLESVAESISCHSGIPIKNIFINCAYAHSEMVFDSGKLEKW
jgi:phenylpyruvate tautomerase PptA (4-oxalocrotonate tautomerase family)